MTAFGLMGALSGDNDVSFLLSIGGATTMGSLMWGASNGYLQCKKWNEELRDDLDLSFGSKNVQSVFYTQISF